MSSEFRRGVHELNARRFLRARRLLTAVVRAGGSDAPWACQEIAQTFLRGGRGPDAEDYLRRVLPAESPLLDHALGYLYRRLGRRADASASLRRASSRRPALYAARLEWGWVCCEESRSKEGVRLLRGAERYFRRRRDDWGVAVALTHRATAALTGGDLARAGHLFVEARAMKSRCGDRLGLATVLTNGGVVFLLQGRLREAVECQTEARGICRALGHRAGEALAANNLGVAHLELAEHEEAADAFRAALRLFSREAGKERERAACLSNLGEILVRAGRLTEALSRFRAALALFASNEVWVDRAPLLAAVAETLTRAGRPDQALRELASTLEGTAGRDPRATIMLCREAARAHLSLGDVSSARSASTRAIRAGHALAEAGSGLLTEVALAGVVHAEILHASGRERQSRSRLSRLVRSIEASIFGESSTSVRMGLLELNRLAHDALLRSMVTLPSGGYRAWALSAGLKARELRRAVEPGPGRSVGPVPPSRPARSVPAIDLGLDLATGDTAILEYHVSRDASVAFVVHDGRIDHVDLGVPGPELGRLVGRHLGPLWAAARSPSPRATLDRFDPRLGSRLFRLVLAPLLARLPASVVHLVVITDGPLHGLPLELLITETAAGVPTYVADRYTVRYLPSVHLLRARPTPRRDGSTLLIGYSPTAGEELITRSHRLALTPLPGVEVELHALRRMFPRSRRLVGRLATVAAVARELPRARLVHMVAHGHFDPREQGDSGVVLARGGRAGPALLTSRCIESLRLRAEHVTLSTCEGGRGRLRGPEGSLSLGRSLLAAGAGSVLAALWPVDDQASAALIEAFYLRWREGMGRAAALAAARLTLRADPVFGAHPFFWAPFVLFERDGHSGSA